MNKTLIRILALALVALAIGSGYLSLAPVAWTAEAGAGFDGDLFESQANPGKYVCICGGDNCAPCFTMPE